MAKLTVAEALTKPTLSIPEAGATFLNLGTNGSYEAAKRGDLPTFGEGKRRRVPTAILAAKLGLRTNFGGEGGAA